MGSFRDTHTHTDNRILGLGFVQKLRLCPFVNLWALCVEFAKLAYCAQEIWDFIFCAENMESGQCVFLFCIFIFVSVFSIFQAEKRNLANVYGPTELLPSTDLVPNLQET